MIRLGTLRRGVRGAHDERREIAHLDDARDHQTEHRQTDHRLRTALPEGHDTKR